MAIILTSITVQSQDSATTSGIPQLKLTPAGVEPVVVPVEGKTATELYQKTLNWVQLTWKNPDMVLKAKVENESVRIEAFAANAWSYKSLGIPMSYGMHYTVEIGFKDGKYRFEYRVGDFSADGAKVLYDYKTFWKKDGTLRKAYAESPAQIDAEMNALNLSLYNYITGKSTTTKKDW